jgi:hypothetical protein
MRRNRDRSSEKGIIVIFVVTAILLALISFVAAFTLLFRKVSTDGTNTGKVIPPPSNNAPPAPNSNNKGPTPSTNNKPIPKPDVNMDYGYLVCVNLPGINKPRTAALDRRVATLWLQVKQDLDAQGIAPLRFSWAYRTMCQQANVNPGGNLKAKSGTSPHEAGRALDVVGMSSRNDASAIVMTFRDHGWHWLGRRDPPHFEIKGYQVGEPSHIAWIQKTHYDFETNPNIAPCKGTECGQ